MKRILFILIAVMLLLTHSLGWAQGLISSGPIGDAWKESIPTPDTRYDGYPNIKRLASTNGYIAGAGGAVSSCNPASNEVGNRASDGSELAARSSNFMYCIAVAADCSGTTGDNAYIYSYQASSGVSAKVAVYTKTGASPADGGNLIAISNALNMNATGWISATLASTSAVTATTDYWLCLVGDGSYYTKANNGVASYLNNTTSYSSIPSTLPATGWDAGTANRLYSAYMEIK